MMKNWQQLTGDVALLYFPLRGFGIDFGRTVTLLRLRDGRLIIHSSAPFTSQDAGAIREFGQPCWLIDATLMHDTFAKQARAVFPNLPYLAPEGFSQREGVATHPLLPAPDDWAGEVDVLPIKGLRLTNEHVFFHRASRTLVVADLLFHFPPETSGWARLFARHVMRLPRLVGLSAFFRMMIRDRAAFATSMDSILQWDFTRIVLAHREPILENAKAEFVRALRAREIDVGS
jgi:hypothetical protein